MVGFWWLFLGVVTMGLVWGTVSVRFDWIGLDSTWIMSAASSRASSSLTQTSLGHTGYTMLFYRSKPLKEHRGVDLDGCRSSPCAGVEVALQGPASAGQSEN